MPKPCYYCEEDADVACRACIHSPSGPDIEEVIAWRDRAPTPPAEAVTVTDGMVLDAVRACVNAAKRGESAEEQMRAAIAAALAAKEGR